MNWTKFTPCSDDLRKEVRSYFYDDNVKMVVYDDDDNGDDRDGNSDRSQFCCIGGNTGVDCSSPERILPARALAEGLVLYH